MAISRERPQLSPAARASRTTNAGSDKRPTAIAARNPTLSSSWPTIARTERYQGERDRYEDPDLVPSRLKEAPAAHPTLSGDPRDEMCVDMREPEDDRGPDQDRGGVFWIGLILLQEHKDCEVDDGAVDLTDREVLTADVVTMAHVGRTVAGAEIPRPMRLKRDGSPCGAGTAPLGQGDRQPHLHVRRCPGIVW